MRRVLAIRRTLAITLSLLVIMRLGAQIDEQLLHDAIQVVRDFVGDQSLTPLFTDEENRVMFFEGPYRNFSFSWIPGYIYIKVRVNPFPMYVCGWCKADDAWLPYVDTNLPEKSDNELLTLARIYASQHFPGWNDFPYWQGRIMGRIKSSGYNKIVRSKIIVFKPYFYFNENKIFFEPAGISIQIEPYQGNIIAFHWHYNLKMTLPSNLLNPTLSPLEAESIAEQKVRHWVAQILAEAGYSMPDNVIFEATLSDPNDPDRDWLGDSRLILGATENSGLRLAYRIDKIQAKDTITGEVLDEWIYALIDAHTGELLRTPERWVGLSERSLKDIFHRHFAIKGILPFGAGLILVSISILVGWFLGRVRVQKKVVKGQ
ncbi:MAG: hypothetical protein C4295_05250 [Candidatus Fervidibacterota bacterium]